MIDKSDTKDYHRTIAVEMVGSSDEGRVLSLTYYIGTAHDGGGWYRSTCDGKSIRYAMAWNTWVRLAVAILEEDIRRRST